MNALTPQFWAERAAVALAKAQYLPSPCVSVCVMDDASGYCRGCWRSIDEIAAWSTLDDAGKRAVWQCIPARAAAADQPPT